MLSPELYKGTLKTIVLNLLIQHQKLYGYEMVNLVKQKSKDKLVITEGALYPTLHKLEQLGLVQFEMLFHGKRQRKYYQLTQEGEAEAKLNMERFKEFAKTIAQILK
jgi:DNA-binding PadR family transcriptional regulator